MPSDDARKRKACQSCTRAKAKCSPFGNRLDLCYRCQRLNKECVFDETARKRGPKTRSRVKQLEQRVESLIDLLGANCQTTTSQATDSIPVTSASTVSSEAFHISVPSRGAENSTDNYNTPVETPDNRSAKYGKIEVFDPIEVGIINEDRAILLLNHFRSSFILSFPFIVIPASDTVDTLRRHQPFLFLAIMATMTYETPPIQHALAEEFKGQIASRIIGCAHKSLEILQGLLVYVAWYHSFYKPKNQQLATVLQLCVALTQDLNLTKDQKDKGRKPTPTENPRESAERASAEKRAFLGTYFLVAAFAQAFRKGKTMSYTKFMAKCCKSLAVRQEQPTDALIGPLIRMSELMCRINDHFSYDDVDDAEIKGDLMLEMSMSNFRSELERIKNSISSSMRQNKALNLYICLLDIWIHECCLYSSLWQSPPHNITHPFSQSRISTLSRALHAMKTYLNTLLETPQTSLHQFAFPAWSGWFYAIIVACKLVFLSYDERSGLASLDALPHELNQFLPNPFRPAITIHQTNSNSHPASAYAITLSWDPVSVAKEADIQSLFERFIEKLRFTFPPEEDDWTDENVDRDPLFQIGCLQRSLLNGFTKKMKEYTSKSSTVTVSSAPAPSSYGPNPNPNPRTSAHANANTNTDTNGTHTNAIADYIQSRAAHRTPTPYHGIPAPVPNILHNSARVPRDYPSDSATAFLLDQFHKHPVPGLSVLNFNSLNFDSLEFNDEQAPVREMMETVDMGNGDGGVGEGGNMNGDGGSGYDDWVWNLMMQDFSMPGM